MFEDNKMTLILSVLILFITLLPLYIIAHFNYPTTDDFCFAAPIYWGIRENESWWNIIKSAWKLVWQYYTTWQGRYFDVSMYCFGLGTAVPELYCIGTYIVLSSFVIATIWFIRTLTYRIMKWESSISWIIAIWFIIIQLWYVPHVSEAFYWYAGATAYTLPYALALMMFTCLICYYNESIGRKKKLYSIVTIILSILVAGSNYAISLLVAEIYAIAIVINVLKKRKVSFLKASFIVYLCGFACNVFSPGNKARLNAVESLGVVGSMVASLKKAASFCVEWFRGPVVILLVFIVYLTYKQIMQTKFDFKLPGLVTIITFGLFASMLTPPFYAGATWGPGRLINTVYYSYFFLLIGNVLYWLGWLINKANIKALIHDRVEYPIGAILIVCCLFLICFKYYGLQSNNSTSAILSLVKGEAKQYRLENEARWELYEDETCIDVVVMDYTVKPRVLYFDDIQLDSSDWRNIGTAQFFGKNSVKIEE